MHVLMQTPSHTAFVLQAVCFDVDSTLWVTASMPPCMLFIEHLFLSWQLASLRLTGLPSEGQCLLNHPVPALRCEDESIDELAEYLGKGAEVAALTAE